MLHIQRNRIVCYSHFMKDNKELDHVHRWITKSTRNLEALSHEALFKTLKWLVQRRENSFSRSSRHFMSTYFISHTVLSAVVVMEHKVRPNFLTEENCLTKET